MRQIEGHNFRTADAFTENSTSTGTVRGRVPQNQQIFGGDAVVML